MLMVMVMRNQLGTLHLSESTDDGLHWSEPKSTGLTSPESCPELTRIPEEYTGAPETTDSASGYGHAKRVSEHASCMYGRIFGFDALIARLFAFVGPLLPLDHNYAVGNFVRDALGGAPVRITGDGTPYRSYLYAADLAVWLWTILLRGRPAYPSSPFLGAPRRWCRATSAITSTSSGSKPRRSPFLIR